MWRLKIAEGGNHPYLYTTNNYVGRQTWEFDPNAGTVEELALVEELRQNFYKNRYQVKPSGDLLWRMQVYIINFLIMIQLFIIIHMYYSQIFVFSSIKTKNLYIINELLLISTFSSWFTKMIIIKLY